MSKYQGLGDLTQDAMMNRSMAVQETLADVPLGLCDAIYASEASTQYRSECDVIRSIRFTQSFPSLNMNGSATLQIPNISIIDSIFMNVVVPYWPTNYYLQRGGLLQLIDRIEYQVGSSNRWTLDGVAHLHYLLETCQSQDQKDALLRLAGESLNNAVATPFNWACPIALPFVRGMYGNHKKFPLDTKMLGLPVTITVFWKASGLAAISGGAGTPVNPTPTQLLPTSFSSGAFSCSQLDFKDPNMSLARDLQLTGGSYIQPALFLQNSIQIPLTSASAVSSAPQLTLTSVRYGNLTSIGLVVVRNADLAASSGTAINPMKWQRLENIILTFNGVRLIFANARVYDLQQLVLQKTPNFAPIETGSGSTSGFTLNGTNTAYYYSLDLSQYSDILEEGSLQSGLEVGANVLNLSFTTPDTNSENCTAFVCYRYPFGIKISQGGQCDYVF
jgi:hypothetical protein